MLILGIETSCDETAAAVVRDGREILSNVVVSQIDIFAEYGGVIPEVAARSHLEVMMPVVSKALSDAGVTWEEIDAIAVTHAPGLLGSLLIGTLTARVLAILHNKPLYAVHHLKSHVYANWLLPREVESVFSSAGLENSGMSYAGQPGEPPASQANLSVSSGIYIPEFSNHFMLQKTQIPTFPQFPLLALVISGGHTQILYMPRHNSFEIVGTTRDDAVGECFDKVAKILGLPYPGGPSIALAAEGRMKNIAPSSDTLEGVRPSGSSASQGAVVPSLRSSKGAMLLHPGNPNRYSFPHPKIPGLDFSFSGLKTAVLRTVQKEVGVPISYPSHKLKELLSPEQVCDFAASFQKTAVEILLEKLQMALEQYPDAKSVVMAGGVSANKKLRARVLSEPLFHGHTQGRSAKPTVREKGVSATRAIPCYFPESSLSGDNGAMVAAAAYYEIMSGVKPTDPYSLNIYPRIEISHD